MIFDFAPRVGLSAKSAAILTNDLRLIFGFVDLSTESLQLATMQLRCHPSVAQHEAKVSLGRWKKTRPFPCLVFGRSGRSYPN